MSSSFAHQLFLLNNKVQIFLVNFTASYSKFLNCTIHFVSEIIKFNEGCYKLEIVDFFVLRHKLFTRND